MNLCMNCGDTIEKAVVLGALRWIHSNNGNVSCELATASPDPGITRAICDVALERTTHAGRGWTPEHDAEHGVGHLVSLAVERANDAARWDFIGQPSYARGQLVKAASLAVAAIELIDRARTPEEDQ